MKESMKAAVLTGPSSIRIQERTIPKIEDGDILIRVKSCGVCGSDIAYYNRGQADVPHPIILGHEFTGEIIEMSELSRKHGFLKIGDRVVVEPLHNCGACWACKRGKPNFCVKPVIIGVTSDGGFAEYCKVNWKFVHLLPKTVSSVEGIFIEPLACAINGIEKSMVSPGDFCVVIGPGPIGLMITQYFKTSGASDIVLVGTRDYRLKVGKKLGVKYLINVREKDSEHYSSDPVSKIIELTDGRGADVVMATTGNAEANQIAIDVGGPSSRTILFGGAGYDPKEYIKLKLWQGTLCEKQINFSWLAPYKFPKAIKIISSKMVKVKPLLTHTFSLDDTAKAIVTVENRLEGVIKAQVKI